MSVCPDEAFRWLQSDQRARVCEELAASSPVTVDRSLLEAIYVEPGFETARQRGGDTFEVLQTQLMAWLNQLLGTSGAEQYSNVTRVVVLALALSVALGAVLRWWPRRRPTVALTVEVAERLELEEPAVHQRRADALLESEPREALREALLSLLSWLEGRAWARPDRVKTNREIGDELTERGAPAQTADRVVPLLRWFDRVFYARAAVSADQAKRFLADVRDVTS